MKTALFIKTKNLGDAVILTSPVTAIRDQYRVHVLCFKDCESIYTDLPGVDRVWAVRRGERGWASIVSGFKLFLELKKIRFDLLAQFSDDWRGAILARLLSVRIRVSHKRSNRIGFWLRSFSHLASITPRRHAVEQDLDLLRRVGLYQGDAPAYELPNDFKVNPRAEKLLSYLGINAGKFVILHLFSRWQFKQLSPQVCHELIVQLSRDGYQVVVTGDHQDAEKFERLGLTENLSVKAVFGEPLATFSALINASLGVISVDSLAIHLASANRKPTLAIFGPSGEDNWRPWKTQQVIFEQRSIYPCRPCGKDGCGGSKVSQCLHTMNAGDIVKAFYKVMSQ